MDTDPIPVFRPSKRQKLFRSRPTEPDTASASPATSSDDQETAAPRFRRPARRLGLTASAHTSADKQTPHPHRDSRAEPAPQDLFAVSARFAPATGLVKDDTDKHM